MIWIGRTVVDLTDTTKRMKKLWFFSILCIYVYLKNELCERDEIFVTTKSHWVLSLVIISALEIIPIAQKIFTEIVILIKSTILGRTDIGYNLIFRTESDTFLKYKQRTSKPCKNGFRTLWNVLESLIEREAQKWPLIRG